MIWTQGGRKPFQPRNWWGAGKNPQDHFEPKDTESHNRFASLLQWGCQQDFWTRQQEKAVSENLNFLIDLTAIAMVVEDKRIAEKDSNNYIKAQNHPDIELQRKWHEVIR